MLHGDPQQPYPDDPKASRGPTKIILVLVGLGVLTVGLFLGAALLVWRHTPAVDDAARVLVEGAAPLGKFDSLEAKHAAAAAAFNSDSVGVSPGRLEPIEHLFDAIVAATRDSDDAGFAREVDTGLLFLEMKHSGVMPPLSPREERSALASVEQGLGVPMRWSRYKIASVQPHTSGNAAMVYGYFWDQGGGEHKVCWWIVRREGGWKAYDWELLDYGMRASKEEAIYYTCGGSSLLGQYLQCKRDLAAADELIEGLESEMAADQIRRTEQLSILPILRDDAWLQIGNAWARCGRIGEALACFGRIGVPEALPGAVYGQALCHSSWGRHEKALRLASRYEALLGRGPAVGRLKGNSLLALGRRSEAVVELRKSLEIEPEQTDLLLSLGLALADQQKPTLADYITRIADPVATAVSLAESFVSYGDSAALKAVSRLLEKIAPDPAAGAYLAGLAKQLAGDAAAAAKLFSQAFGQENDTDTRQQYVRRYLGAMISAGQLAEGYLGAPDPVAAFRYLADCYVSGDYPISRQAFARLLDAHRRNQPEDPWLYYYTGLFLAQREAYDEAEKQYLAGMAKTEDQQVLAAFRYPRIWAFYAAGKGLEAYKKIGPASETFRQLAGCYGRQHKLTAEQAAELKSLVEAHRAAQPDDPWLDFCAGLVAQQAGDYDEADRLFARGFQLAGEDGIRSAYHQRRLDARLESGKILPALESLPFPRETFAYLARRLSAGRKWPQLKSLIETYRRLDPASPEIRRWEVELLWQQRDYAGVVDLLAPSHRWDIRDAPPNGRATAAEQLPAGEASELGERLVRSYLRLTRTAEAQAAAEAMYKRGESMPLILTSAMQRDVQKTAQLLGELLPAQYLVTAVYYDEDVGRIVRGEGFLPLRREYPPGLRFDMAGASAVVLLKEVRVPDSEQLRGLLAAAWATDVTVTRLAAGPPADTATSFVARASGQVCSVTFGSGRYRPDAAAHQPTLHSPALKQALAEHRGWLAISVSACNDVRAGTQFSAACRLAAGLLDDSGTAIYFSNEGRLVPVEAAYRGMLRSVQWPAELSEAGEEVWLLRDARVDEEAQKAIQRRRRRLKAFCSAFAGRELPQQFFVQVQLRLGPASETHWLAVRRVIHGSYGSVRIVAEFVAPSLLAPEFRPGEPICVEPYDVVDWKSTGQEREPAGEGPPKAGPTTDTPDPAVRAEVVAARPQGRSLDHLRRYPLAGSILDPKDHMGGGSTGRRG